MDKQHKHLYKFDLFLLDVEERLLLKDGDAVMLAPKAFDILALFVRNSGRLIDKDELMRAVWPGVTVEETNISMNVSLLRKALGDQAREPRFIKTVPKLGYRFIAPVQPSWEEGNGETSEDHSSRDVEDPPGHRREDGEPGVTDGRPSRWRLESPFAGHFWHVVTGCALYALLYSIALMLEVAYEFDRYGARALQLVPPVFVWIFSTSMAGLELDRRKTRQGKATGLVFSLIIFVAAGVLLYWALGYFLPGEPITKAYFQTYSARAAFLKDVYYFVPLGVIFLALPFHFVVSMGRALQAEGSAREADLLFSDRTSAVPMGAIYVKVSWLGILLSSAAMVSMPLTAHLIENLKSDPYMGLFIELLQWRVVVYFALGLECLIWYYRALNEIKRACLARA
jgi:DNA-binding winged helix-turn-helix (wHTH) protein